MAMWVYNDTPRHKHSGKNQSMFAVWQGFVWGGEIAFVGRENVKNIQQTWGEN